MTRDEFEHLALKLRPALLGMGRRFFGNGEDAEDVVQETLLRLWVVRDRLDDYASLDAIAIRIAKNYCINLWHSRQREQEVTLSDTMDVATRETPESRLVERENRKWLQRVTESLPTAERRLLRMKQEEGMDTQEIATATGIGVRSVSAMISTARRRLYDKLRKEG